jgi:hypothetical protein
MIMDVHFNDPGTLFSGFATSTQKSLFSGANPPAARKLRSGLKATIAPIDGSVHYHSLLELASRKEAGSMHEKGVRGNVALSADRASFYEWHSQLNSLDGFTRGS